MNATSVIPLDEPSVFEILNSLTTLDKQAIVRPNNPPPGLAGFLFDIAEEEEISVRSNITDHFVEANSAINDQIALLPEEYTVRGLKAEVAMVAPKASAVAKVENPLPDNPALSPQLTESQDQQQALDVTPEKRIALAADDLFSLFENLAQQPPAQTKQARTLAYFVELWKSRQLFTVETPFGFLTNMAILTMRATQPEDTRFQSTFTITFKHMRFTGVATVTAGQLAGRAAAQSAGISNNGTAGQTPVMSAQRQSLLYRIANGP